MNPRRKLSWIALLYFAEGFPFGVVMEALPVYFRTHGVSLTEIGLMSLLGLPWTLKLLWSPLVDRYGSRQAWILPCLGAIATILLLLPLLDAGHVGWAVWGLLLCLTIASATQDVAIDAYTIGIVTPGEEGPANGVRVAAYRAALVASGGGMLLFAAAFGWSVAFTAGGALCLFVALLIQQSPRLPAASSTERANSFGGLQTWLTRSRALAVVVFVLLYKVGDAAMGPMVRPFWVDRGLDLAEIGLIANTFGVGLTVLGALVGGWFTSRYGIFISLLVLGLAQALSNLGYAAVALLELGRAGIYAASMLESLTGGLGTAAFLSFLMHVCDKRHAAVHYAFLSALFGLSRSIAGAFSGWATTELGYASYFAFTFLLALPGLALLPAIRPWVREDPRERADGAE